MNEPTDPTAGVDEPKLSAADKRQRSKYLREFVPAMTAYAVALAVAIGVVDEDTAAAEIWILLPVLPLVGVGIAIYRSVQRADEYSRLLQLEAMGLAFGVAMITALVLGFLGIVGVALTYGGWIVFAAGMVTWAVMAAFRGSDAWTTG